MSTHKTAIKDKGIACLAGGVLLFLIGAIIGNEATILAPIGAVLAVVGVVFLVGSAMTRPD